MNTETKFSEAGLARVLEAVKKAPTFTPGPWRWEFNAEHKSVHLVGGDPRFDLSIMDFTRWGMGGAGVCLRDTAHDGMNIMHKLHERPDWIVPFPGRRHHRHWCADVAHPDMRLIAAAPDLLEALISVLANTSWAHIEDAAFQKARTAIAKALGSQQ